MLGFSPIALTKRLVTHNYGNKLNHQSDKH